MPYRALGLVLLTAARPPRSYKCSIQQCPFIGSSVPRLGNGRAQEIQFVNSVKHHQGVETTTRKSQSALNLLC
uniref:Secreted protein n=1 Tax=Strongyloides venezuelensis TaxID=75913 RepID=A0A0K0FRM8_STRVS